MGDTRVWQHTVEQRRALSRALASLTPEQWKHESLCAGWTVQDVAAHVISSPQLQQGRLVWEVLRARGDVDSVTFRDAKRRSAWGVERILADFERYAEDPGHFVGARRADLLLDVVVHSQDALRPLGVHHEPPPEAAALAADRAWAHRRLLGTRPLLQRLRLVATDADWSRGRGPAVEGPTLELLMLCAGRAPDVSALGGEGVEVLTRR